MVVPTWPQDAAAAQASCYRLPVSTTACMSFFWTTACASASTVRLVAASMVAEYALLEEDGIVKLPGHLSLEGTGGVSVFGLQLARINYKTTPSGRRLRSD